MKDNTNGSISDITSDLTSVNAKKMQQQSQGSMLEINGAEIGTRIN